MPLSDLEQQVLQLLTESSDGRPFRLRVRKLADLLDRPVDEICRALDALKDTGEIALQSSRARGGPHVLLLHPPAEHRATRLSNFRPFSQPQE